MTAITDINNFVENKMSLGEEWRSVSKNNVGYGKMKIKYNNERFLFLVPSCKTLGVQSTEMENGYTRRTMPLIFDDQKTRDQERFTNVFEQISQKVYELLIQRGYNDNRLMKLDSCFWRNKVLYTSVVESFLEYENNTRFFVGNKEENPKDGEEYEAKAAILIDSIYIGEKTVSIQVKLYEVSLTPTKKRARVLC